MYIPYTKYNAWHQQATVSIEEFSSLDQIMLPSGPVWEPFGAWTMNGCLKAILITAAVLIGSLALMCGGFVLLARIPRDRGAPRAGASAPPPTTPSADETRLGKEPGYCPGRGLKHLGLFAKGPPCAVELYLGSLTTQVASNPLGGAQWRPGKSHGLSTAPTAPGTPSER